MSDIYDEDDSNYDLPDESNVNEPGRRWSDNPLRDAAIRLLNTPARLREDPDDIETDAPPVIDPQKVTDIPKLGSLDDGIDLFKALGRNLELQEGVGELTDRVQKLEYLKKANKAKRCDHVKTNGIPCGSPAVGGRQYCFFHELIHKKRIMSCRSLRISAVCTSPTLIWREASACKPSPWPTASFCYRFCKARARICRMATGMTATKGSDGNSQQDPQGLDGISH